MPYSAGERSATVRMPGRTAVRDPVRIASIRIFPAFICGSAVTMPLGEESMRPEIRSTSACAPPL